MQNQRLKNIKSNAAILFLFGIYSVYLAVLTLNPFEFSADYFTEFIRFQTGTLLNMLFQIKLLDVIGNILLFIPIGFFLGVVLKSWDENRYFYKVSVLYGFLLSLFIECVQLFTNRTSSVIDLVANTAGAVLGYYLMNNLVVRSLAKKGIDVFRNKKILPLVSVFVYALGLFFLFILPFRLNSTNNWNPDYPLMIGNEITLDRPWEGQVFLTAVYDRALNVIEIDSLNDSYENDSNFRMDMGCVALYTFSEEKSVVVHDISEFNDPLDLTRENISWRAGGVELTRQSKLFSAVSAEKINNAILHTSEFSVEVWFRTKNIEQGGPARIITVSNGTDERNFTLAQNGRDIYFRVRTSIAGLNGSKKNLIVKSILRNNSLHHIVATFHHGVEKLYFDGSPAGVLRGDIEYLSVLLNMGQHAIGQILLLFVLLFPLGLLIYYLFDKLRFLSVLLFPSGFMLVIQSCFYLLCAQPFSLPILIIILITSVVAYAAGWAIAMIVK